MNLPKAQRECGYLLRRGIEVSQCLNSGCYTSIRPHSILSRPFRRKRQDPFFEDQSRQFLPPRRCCPSSAISPVTPTPAGILRNAFRKLRAIDDKDSLDGPRFRSKDLTQEEITRIFGLGVPEDIGNRILRFQHGRRLDGTLDDNSDSPAHDLTKKLASTALAWLRQEYPVDEKAAYRARIEREEGRRQTEIIADAERLGIYKPQSGVKPGDVYGKSVLEEIREEYAIRAKVKKAQKEAAAKRQAEEIKKNTGALEKIAPKTELSTCFSCKVYNGLPFSSC